jgi:hypothetical protein
MSIQKFPAARLCGGMAILLFALSVAAAEAPTRESQSVVAAGRYLSQRTELHLPARLNDLRNELAAPLHSGSLRQQGGQPVTGREAELSQGYVLQIHDARIAQRVAVSMEDFRAFMNVCMEVRDDPRAYRIVAERGDPKGCPSGAAEAFHLTISASDCRIEARDADGVRRALVYLEDEMTARQGPWLALGEVSRWATIRDRIVHCPVAPYRWMTGWELEYDDDFYADQYLNKLTHSGVNGIWVAGLLRRMVASKVLPELGPPTHRLARLKRLVERAARYGIKVYLFCIEPRAVWRDHQVFAAHPEIRGAGGVCLCTSTKLVQQYIRETMRELFKEVPDLAGVINIFNGERYTTCWPTEQYVQSCPRCKLRPQTEVLAEDLTCAMEGIRQSSPTARLLAWTYMMKAGGLEQQSMDPVKDMMQRSHAEITWLGNFEHGGKKELCGKMVGINEYSLSYTGPSEAFRIEAAQAKDVGRSLYAKLQVGTSFEMGAMPSLPLPGVVYDKLAAMRSLGVPGTMAGWIVGGDPGIMLKALGEAACDPLPSKDEFLQRLAARSYPAEVAPKVVRAWQAFADAFALYPCSNVIFYRGPIARCPAYQLHLEREPRLALPYNWGFDRQRRPQPYEDQIARWLGPFTVEELLDSFRRMGRRWQEGLDLLAECRREHPQVVELARQYAIAAAARVQFLSTANVIEFYWLRDALRDGPRSRQRDLLDRLCAVAQADIALAEEMKGYQAAVPAIGFHSEIFDYSFSPQLLADKIRHTRKTLETLERWQQMGVELNVLNASLPAPLATPSGPPSLNDPDPIRWSD